MKRTAVFGASSNPNRYSFRAVQALRRAQIECVAIGLHPGYIDDLAIQQAPDCASEFHTVSLYIAPKNQAPWKEMILSLRPKRVIFNPGTENTEFESELIAKGIAAEHACTLVLLSTGQF